MERETFGVVLTGGSQIKTSGGYRLEPDREGKMRALAGLEDLKQGKISKLLIAGGARNHGVPLANIYTSYLRRFLKRYNLGEESVVEIKGGTNTLSDLQATQKQLSNLNCHIDVNLYSSGYHFERKSVLDFAKKVKTQKTSFIKAEEKIKERHRLYGEAGRKLGIGPIAERVLTPEFVTEMRNRNKKVDLINNLHLTWVVQTGAYLLRR